MSLQLHCRFHTSIDSASYLSHNYTEEQPLFTLGTEMLQTLSIPFSMASQL